MQGIKRLSQQKLAKELNTSHSVIRRYERDEMTPSIEVAKKMGSLLNITVGYLLGEVEEADTLKDPLMLQRLNDINNLSDEEKNVYSLAWTSSSETPKPEKLMLHKTLRVGIFQNMSY